MIMKWTRLMALLFCLTSCYVLTTAQSNESSLLWKVEGDDIQTSYVYGTFHILPQSDFDLSDQVTKAFNEADQIALELDFDDPSLQANMMRYANMEDGQTLDKLIDKEVYDEIDLYLQSTMGVGMQAFNKWKPFLLTSLVMGKLIEGQPASFELTFVKMAMEGKKEIVGLETAKDQLAIFDKIPYQDQADDVEEMFTDEKKTKETFQKMINLYKEGNIDKLVDFTRDYIDNPEEFKMLLSDRNEKWIPKMAEMSKENAVFYGVGAGHLGGEKGVINLLKEAGYTVTPVK